MPDLSPQSALKGYQFKQGTLLLEEKSDFALFSLSPPLGQKAQLEKKFEKIYQTAWPKPGKLTKSAGRYFISMNEEQIFALFFDATTHQNFCNQLGDSGYITDQSDNWCCLRLAGRESRSALERICPVDLHPSIFDAHANARTVMEHCNTIILRDQAPDSFLLLSARSSAHSFLHAVVQSIKNIT